MVPSFLSQQRYTKDYICFVLQMCSQEAVLRPGGALSAIWGAGGWSEKPVPVSGATGWGAGAG